MSEENEFKCRYADECSSVGIFDDCWYDHWVVFPCPNIEVEAEEE